MFWSLFEIKLQFNFRNNAVWTLMSQVQLIIFNCIGSSNHFLTLPNHVPSNHIYVSVKYLQGLEIQAPPWGAYSSVWQPFQKDVEVEKSKGNQNQEEIWEEY